MRELIILASGASSRFWPLAQDRHKTFYPVGLGRSIFYYTLERLKREGWNRVILTVRPCDMERAMRELPEGMDAITVLQDEAKGEGDAILRASRHVRSETFYVTSADKIYAGALIGRLRDYTEECGEHAVLIATAPTASHWLYGMVRQEQNGRIREIAEKPATWDDPMPRKIVSAYRLNRVFLGTLERAPNEQYNFEAALHEYALNHAALSVPVEDIPEATLKYPWHLLALNRLMMRGLAHFISPHAHSEQGAIISPPVRIEEGVRIAGSAVVRGPCVIRKGAIIGDHALVRDHSSIGKDVLIGAGSEVKNSIIYDGAKLHDSHALDSIIDEGCNLGAGTRISNTRFDGEPVKSVVKDKMVSTEMRHFGIVMGKGTHTATLANLMPGVKIGQNCRIGGSFAVMKDIPDNHSAYVNEDGKVMVKPRK